MVPLTSLALGKMPGTGFNSSMLSPCMSFAELPHPAIEQAIMTAMLRTQPLIRFVTIVPPYFSVR
jgi:hypothetical protein